MSTPVDYGGTAQDPLTSFSKNASEIAGSGDGYAYVFAGSSISITAGSGVTVSSVTSDRGLTIADGSLSGSVIGTADVTVAVSSATLTIHVVPVYRTVLYTPRNNTNRVVVKGVISTLDGTQTAQCHSDSLFPDQRACMLQTTAPIAVYAECIHSDPYPDSIVSSRIPWIISEWDICLYKNDAYHHTGLLYRQIENYRDEITLTLTSADYNENPTGSGIFGISIRPYPYTNGVFAVFFDARICGTEFPTQFICPGISLPEDPVREYELNNISAPIYGTFQLGPTGSSMATVEVDSWQRAHTTSDDSDDISVYSPLIPEQTEEVSVSELGAITGNRIWYRPLTHLLTVDEDQDAIFIFDNGGGKFVTSQKSVMPSAQYITAGVGVDIGKFYYDWIEDCWYWFSGKSVLPVGEEATVRFTALPHTESVSGTVDNSYSLLPPDGMAGMASWDTEKPFFRGVDDAASSIQRISFLYNITPRKSQDGIIRRTFYPSWIPALNDGDNQRAVLVTPGHKTIEIHNIQTVTETYNAVLDVKPIVVYGYKRSFCMDLGVSKKVSLKYIRPGLPYPADPSNPSLRECDNNSGDSRRWSNAKWIEEMQELLNRWQMRTNGSELYLLRPGSGRLSVSDTDTDPMRSYITKTVGENCYISEFSIPYADSPYTISGTLGLTIGTLYPKVPSRPLATVNIYQPIYNRRDYPPGTVNNPYTSYSTTIYNTESLPSDIYIVEGSAVEISGVLGEGTYMSPSTGIRFSNASSESHGLICERTESVRQYGIGFYRFIYSYSISGTLDQGAPYVINTNIETYKYAKLPNKLEVASTRPFTIHVVPAASEEPAESGEPSYRITSRRYPVSALMMLPEPASLFGTSGVQIITVPTPTGNEYRVSGTAVSSWHLFEDETEYPPRTVMDISKLYVQSLSEYRLYGVGKQMDENSAHFFFPPTEGTDSPETRTGQRFVYDVTVTPDPDKTMTVMWTIVGGGGGGGGAGCTKSLGYTSWWHGGGGGGGGRPSGTYIKESSVPVTFRLCCGSGGKGGNSPTIHMYNLQQEYGSGTNGSDGQSSILYLLNGGTYVSVSNATYGYGGKGAKYTDVDPDKAAEGGKGFRDGGAGSYDYEVQADSGVSAPRASVDNSGKGGSGGRGANHILTLNSGSTGRVQYVHIPGGGGGGGGYYETGMAEFANAGNGGSYNAELIGEGNQPRLPMAGYSAGGGGGGGYFKYELNGNTYLIKPSHGGHGGHGWGYVTVVNGTVSVSEVGWQS